jgi:hypothetical protein
MTPVTLVTGYSLSDLESTGTSILLSRGSISLPPQYILNVKVTHALTTDGVVRSYPAGLAIYRTQSTNGVHYHLACVWDGTYWRRDLGIPERGFGRAHYDWRCGHSTRAVVSVAGPMTGPTTRFTRRRR